jgi:hypothetical protein
LQAPRCWLLGSATLSPLSDAYMFMYPSSFQLLYGRSPTSARRHTQALRQRPAHRPQDIPPTRTHQVSTRFYGRYPPRSARRPHMLFDSYSTAARPSTPGHPPHPHPRLYGWERYGTHHRRGGGQPSNQSKFAARTSTVNGWHELGPLLPGGGLTIHFHRCWYVLVGRLIDDLVCNYLGRAAAL